MILVKKRVRARRRTGRARGFGCHAACFSRSWCGKYATITTWTFPHPCLEMTWVRSMNHCMPPDVTGWQSKVCPGLAVKVHSPSIPGISNIPHEGTLRRGVLIPKVSSCNVNSYDENITVKSGFGQAFNIRYKGHLCR